MSERGMNAILAIAVVFLSYGSCNKKEAEKVTDAGPSLEKKEPLPVGRYQYVPNTGGYFNHGRLIDTATGRIWIVNCLENDKAGKCADMAWVEEDVIGLSMTWQDYFDRVEKRKAQKK